MPRLPCGPISVKRIYAPRWIASIAASDALDDSPLHDSSGANTPVLQPGGTITLTLDNEAFRKGFLAAREWYFADIYGKDGRKPEEPQHAVAVTTEEVLRLVVMPDEQGRYHFNEMGYENQPEYLGYLVGYLSGPLAPQEAEHYRREQAQQEYLCRRTRGWHDEGRDHFPSLS